VCVCVCVCACVRVWVCQCVSLRATHTLRHGGHTLDAAYDSSVLAHLSRDPTQRGWEEVQTFAFVAFVATRCLSLHVTRLRVGVGQRAQRV